MKENSIVHQLVLALRHGGPSEQIRAVHGIRYLVSNPDNKEAIRDAGGMHALLENLTDSEDSPLTTLIAETVACLIADDDISRHEVASLSVQNQLREAGGIVKIVKLLFNGPQSETTQRALLAIRILAEREIDRIEIMKYGGVAALTSLLKADSHPEIAEYATAALGNLAAGSEVVKNILREFGVIPALVQLIRQHPHEVSAELAVIALKNMSLRNSVNRRMIQDCGGLAPIQKLLSKDLHRLECPLPCQAEYFLPKNGKSPSKIVSCVGQCSFDPSSGQLYLVTKKLSKGLCFGIRGNLNPRGKKSWKFSLMNRFSVLQPNSRTLELDFLSTSKEGVSPVIKSCKSNIKDPHLLSVTIHPCAATELKGALMRMLTKMHVEREFGLKMYPWRIPSHTRCLSEA